MRPGYNIDRHIQRSLTLNIVAGSLGMVFITVFGSPIGSPMLTGFLRTLGADDLIYSIIMALPVLGAATQIAGSYFLENTGKRRPIFIVSAFVHRLLWIPVALIPIWIGLQSHTLIIGSIMALISVSMIANSISVNAFTSWMSDLCPRELSGRYFSKRSLFLTTCGVAAGLVLSLILDRIQNLHGYAIVFVTGALFGAAEVFLFFAIRHPAMKKAPNRMPIHQMIIKPLKDKKYLQFILFATLFAFGVNFASPFFNVYMIENLHMNFFTITLSTLLPQSATTIVLVRKWGTLADRFGHDSILFLCALGLSLLPLLWILASPGSIITVVILYMLYGVFWSGYNVALFNHSIWLAPSVNRSAYIATYTFINSSLGISLAYICGGWFMRFARTYIPEMTFWFVRFNAFSCLIALSTVIQLVVALAFMPIMLKKSRWPKSIILYILLKLKMGKKRGRHKRMQSDK